MDKIRDDAPSFYDDFADLYDIGYAGRWDEVVDLQGATLDGVIRGLVRDASLDILDCSCGIGTQAIGLARRGHRVVGSDISGGSIRRAEREAARLGARVNFVRADFRDLATVGGQFDVVLALDNALAHLLTDDDLRQALASMYARLRPRGLLITSTRDFDLALVERPPSFPTVISETRPRRILIRLHDWDESGAPFYTARFVVLVEEQEGWSVSERRLRIRAVTRAAMHEAALNAGFVDGSWLDPEAGGFEQPLFHAFRR